MSESGESQRDLINRLTEGIRFDSLEQKPNPDFAWVTREQLPANVRNQMPTDMGDALVLRHERYDPVRIVLEKIARRMRFPISRFYGTESGNYIILRKEENQTPEVYEDHRNELIERVNNQVKKLHPETSVTLTPPGEQIK